MKTTYYKTPATGWLKLDIDASDRVVAAVFVDRPGADQSVPRSISHALDDYFTNGANLPERTYILPPTGTDFQREVWRAISDVPFGETITYTQLAQAVGRPKAARTAGTACGKNPLALFIPCHRVVRTTGEDLGYSWGPERKRWLLEHEGIKV